MVFFSDTFEKNPVQTPAKNLTQIVREISELRHSQTISFERGGLERIFNGQKKFGIAKFIFELFTGFNSFETLLIARNLDWFGQENFKVIKFLAKCC